MFNYKPIYNNIKGSLLALLIPLLLLPNFVRSETINMAAIDWCPQLCSDNKKPGYIKDIVYTIFAESPYQLKIDIFPWSRAIKYVRSGKYQVLLSPAKAEAPDLIYPKNEVGLQRMCFFTWSDSTWQYQGNSSLKNLEIGMAVDTSIGKLNTYFINNKNQFQLMPYNDSYLNNSLKKLKARRIDTFIFTLNSTLYHLNTNDLQNVYSPAGCVSSEKIYMAFTPNLRQKEMVTSAINYFDEKMKQLKGSQQLKQIMSKYGLEPW